MSVHALTRNAAYRGQLTIEDVELEGALDGHSCRCTIYKPILDAAKTFVGEYMKEKVRMLPGYLLIVHNS